MIDFSRKITLKLFITKILLLVMNLWKSLSLEISDLDQIRFHDGGRYHIETSPLICGVNQWTGFYMISASVMKGLINLKSC